MLPNGKEFWSNHVKIDTSDSDSEISNKSEAVSSSKCI
jgi:hypothetical protein